jgi:Flp pilus assembly pilin Flp
MMISIGRIFRRLVRKDDGSMTVEWIAIAAAVIIGAVAVTYTVLGGLKAPAAKIGTQLCGTGGC